jgi:hypothetical protein
VNGKSFFNQKIKNQANRNSRIYKRRDDEIRSLSTDKDTMNDTWEEWQQAKIRFQKTYQQAGVTPVAILVLPVEGVRYCRERGLAINGESRAQFVSWKLMMA